MLDNQHVHIIKYLHITRWFNVTFLSTNVGGRLPIPEKKGHTKICQVYTLTLHTSLFLPHPRKINGFHWGYFTLLIGAPELRL